MADPLPAGPDEAANRARVQAIAQGGMQAAQQAPSIATAPEAMQTAMARSAGINAPDLFNATQVATIQNPFTRADSQLAADQAGAGGVLGSINSSTADYLQKASGGVDIQREITRRTYQQLAQQHEFDAQDLAIKKIEADARLAEANALKDPNSPQGKLKADKLANDIIAERIRGEQLNTKPLAASASSTKDIQSRTGETTATQKEITTQPWYNSMVMRADGTGVVDSVLLAKGDTSMLRSSIADGIKTGNAVWQAEIDAGNKDPGSNPLALDPANNALTSAQIYAQYAPMLPNFEETNIDAANFAQGAFANKFVQPGSAPSLAPAAPTQVLVPAVPNMHQAAVERAQAQAAPPAPYPMSVTPSLQQAALAQAHAQPLPPGIAPTPQLPPATVLMSDADAKALATKAAAAKKSSRGKSKRK